MILPMGITTRSPFVLDYSPAELRSILSGLEFILAECPDYVRDGYWESQPVLDFMQELTDALKTQPGDPYEYWDRLNTIKPKPPETEDQKRLRIWNLANPEQRRRLEIRGLKPEGVE